MKPAFIKNVFSTPWARKMMTHAYERIRKLIQKGIMQRIRPGCCQRLGSWAM